MKRVYTAINIKGENALFCATFIASLNSILDIELPLGHFSTARVPHEGLNPAAADREWDQFFSDVDDLLRQYAGMQLLSLDAQAAADAEFVPHGYHLMTGNRDRQKTAMVGHRGIGVHDPLSQRTSGVPPIPFYVEEFFFLVPLDPAVPKVAQ